MSKTNNEVVSKIIKLIESQGYTSEFDSNTLKYNDKTYTLPSVSTTIQTRNTKLR